MAVVPDDNNRAAARDNGAPARDCIAHAHCRGIGRYQAWRVEGYILFDRRARGFRVQHNCQGQACDTRNHFLRAAQDGCGRRDAHVFNSQRSPPQGRIHNRAQGHIAFHQGVRLDHNARRLNIHNIKSPERRPKPLAGKRHNRYALLYSRKIDSLDKPFPGDRAQEGFRSLQAHLDLADKAVCNHQVCGNVVIVDIYFHLRFQPVTHAHQIPHCHGHQNCDKHGAQIGQIAHERFLFVRGLH